MPQSISVIDILSNAQQLESLPVGESLKVLFSEEPDMYNIEQNVAIVRVNSDQDVPNFSNLVYRIQDESEYGTVPTFYSGEATTEGYVLTVTPEEFLTPNSNYYLIVGESLAPISYTVAKTVTLGPSNIAVQVESSGTSEDAVYVLEVITQSSLSNGQHTVEFSLTKDTVFVANYVMDLNDNNVLQLNNTISLVINPQVPFLLTEEFTITLESFSRLGETKAQAFSTFLTSDVIENAAETSQALTQSQILEFYENTTWGQQMAEATETVDPSAKTAIYTFQYPNKIIIDLEDEVLVSSISPSTFTITITHAFLNYLLPQMGLYDESKKYVITYNAGAGPNTKQIILEINEDTANLVTDPDIFIVQAA
jgi:hypothetical protein